MSRLCFGFIFEIEFRFTSEGVDTYVERAKRNCSQKESQNPHPLIPERDTPFIIYLRRKTNTKNKGSDTIATAAI